MSAHTNSVEPPKPSPLDDGLPAGPVEPPKEQASDDGLPPGPAEPPKPAPQEDPQVSATANDAVSSLEPFDAPQAPLDVVSAAAAGEIGASEAPQAPGPEISLAP